MKKEYEYCLRCGRKMKNEEARLRGFGLVCWKKHLIEHAQPKLFEEIKPDEADRHS